jgi:hypothetical protein
MGPLVTLLLLVPVFLGGAWLFRDLPLLLWLLILVAIAPVFEYCRHYAKFARTDPDRLQSEEYRYGLKKIQMIAAKELPYPMSAESLSLPEPISNPAHPLPPVPAKLTSGAGEHEGETA